MKTKNVESEALDRDREKIQNIIYGYGQVEEYELWTFLQKRDIIQYVRYSDQDHSTSKHTYSVDLHHLGYISTRMQSRFIEFMKHPLHKCTHVRCFAFILFMKEVTMQGDENRYDNSLYGACGFETCQHSEEACQKRSILEMDLYKTLPFQIKLIDNIVSNLSCGDIVQLIKSVEIEPLDSFEVTPIHWAVYVGMSLFISKIGRYEVILTSLPDLLCHYNISEEKHICILKNDFHSIEIFKDIDI